MGEDSWHLPVAFLIIDSYRTHKEQLMSRSDYDLVRNQWTDTLVTQPPATLLCGSY